MTIVHSMDVSTNPQDSIRTDLWDTMSLSELAHQHVLMMDRVTQIIKMMDAMGTSQTIMDMYLATNHALDSLNKMIEHKTVGNFNT